MTDENNLRDALRRMDAYRATKTPAPASNVFDLPRVATSGARAVPVSSPQARPIEPIMESRPRRGSQRKSGAGGGSRTLIRLAT
jgi:hypothetical protein